MNIYITEHFGVLDDGMAKESFRLVYEGFETIA